MRQLAPVMPAALLSLLLLSPSLLSPSLHGQALPSGTLPATVPSQGVLSLPSAQAAAPAAPGSEARVLWTGAQLTIQSNGDNLRNILRAVSQATGMRVTGGVPEELVFGTYGPGSVQQVLPRLFEGMSVNVMLVNDGATQPRELLLTQRTGGPTPPQAQPIADQDQGFRQRRFGPGPQGNGYAPPQQPAPLQQVQPNGSTGGVQPQLPAVDTTQVPAAGTDAGGQPASPNGVRTPEQIFQELRLRQQQQGSATPR